MRGRLGRLVALANRPGTSAEGATARAHAERLARREGSEIFESSRGELIVVDEFHADLLHRLEEIAGESCGAVPPRSLVPSSLVSGSPAAGPCRRRAHGALSASEDGNQ